MNRNLNGNMLTRAELEAMVPGLNLGSAAGHGYELEMSALLTGTMHIRYEMFLNRELELRTEVRADTVRHANKLSVTFLAGVTHHPGNKRFGRGKEVYNGRLGHPHVETT